MTMNWFSVLVFISLYSLCLGGVAMEKRSLGAADDDKGNIFGRMIIGQILGSDSIGLGEKSYQASNSSQLLKKIGDYIYEIIRKEHQSFVDHWRDLQHSNDLEEIFILLGETSKRLEQIVTGPSLKEILMKDPQFLEQHAKASLENAGNRGNAMQINRNPCSGPVPDIGKVNGFYGDRSKLNLKDEAGTILDKYETNVNGNIFQLGLLHYDLGGKTDPESRLGAYYATRGYKAGSVGNTVHNIIGGMYLVLGIAGEEKMGRIYNDQFVKTLLNQPMESDAARCLAAIEDRYFANVKKENLESLGAALGLVCTFRTRDCFIQLLSGVFCS